MHEGAEQKTKIVGSIIGGVLALFFVSMLTFVVYVSRTQNDWAESCKQNAQGFVTPTLSTDGVVLESINGVFIRGDDQHDHLLGQCAKGGCSNNLPRLFAGKHGERIHAEFCMNKLVLVTYKNNVVYIGKPPAEEVASQSRLGLLMACAVIFSFWFAYLYSQIMAYRNLPK